MEFKNIEMLSILVALEQRLEHLFAESNALRKEDITTLGVKGSIDLIDAEIRLTKTVFAKVNNFTSKLTLADRMKAKREFYHET